MGFKAEFSSSLLQRSTSAWVMTMQHQAIAQAGARSLARFIGWMGQWDLKRM